jgi:hypothetical protein
MKSFCNCADNLTTAPDPRKHVNYVQGMVLGADDLIQDFVHQRHQRHWLARDAIGYGTLTGLRVEAKLCDAKDGSGKKVMSVVVSPGAALTPRGQLLRVAPEQCADINQWLASKEAKEAFAEAQLTIPAAGFLDAYVVLCFRECEVDLLPVPGEPCRCEDRAMKASRIMDDFRLELRASPPKQTEEDAICKFIHLLKQIKVRDESPIPGSIETFINALREATRDLSSLLGSPLDFHFGSPLEDLVISESELCDHLRAAMKFWVTELRPQLQARWKEYVGGGCGCHEDERTLGDDEEGCLLLARVTLQLTGGQVKGEMDAKVSDSMRPLVVHLRMLQEMLLCGPCCGETPEPPIKDHGALTGLEDDDHLQYLLVNGGRALGGNLSAANVFTITNLRPAAANGEAVPFQQAIKVNDLAQADLADQYPNPRVQKIQGNAIKNVTPITDGDVLTWNNGNSEWEPRGLPSVPTTTIEEVAVELPTAPFVTISRLPDSKNRMVFQLWFHVDVGDEATANLREIPAFKTPMLSVFCERDTQGAPPFLTPCKFSVINVPLPRNVFQIEVQKPDDKNTDFLLRFNFHLVKIQLANPASSALAWIKKRPLKWLGHDGEDTITEFYRGAAQIGYIPVAAGRFGSGGGNAIAPSLGRPRATPVQSPNNSLFRLTFDGFDENNSYIIKGVPIVKAPTDALFTFVVGMNTDNTGIEIQIQPRVPPGGFMLDVHQIL